MNCYAAYALMTDLRCNLHTLVHNKQALGVEEAFRLC